MKAERSAEDEEDEEEDTEGRATDGAHSIIQFTVADDGV